MSTNYTHCGMLGQNNATELVTLTIEVRNYRQTHKLCVRHSIDLVSHMVFQDKSGTEPQMASNKSIPQVHIVFHSKLGTKPTNGKQQVWSIPQGHILFQSKLGTEPTNGNQQVL
jgi:hypothetical protein